MANIMLIIGICILGIAVLVFGGIWGKKSSKGDGNMIDNFKTKLADYNFGRIEYFNRIEQYHYRGIISSIQIEGSQLKIKLDKFEESENGNPGSEWVSSDTKELNVNVGQDVGQYDLKMDSSGIVYIYSNVTHWNIVLYPRK
jgi:hypothetical protein